MTQKLRKTGMQIVASTYEKLTERAKKEQRPIWKLTEEALEAYLNIKQANPIPRHLWKYPEKLRDILASGDEIIIDAITRSIDAFHDRLRVEADHTAR